MRRRAFTPALYPLEDRIVLASLGQFHGPYGLAATTYGEGIYLIKNYFELYAVSGDFERLRGQLAALSVGIPYHRATGMGPKTNAALDQMLVDIHDHAPHPINTAEHKILKSIHTDVQKLIDSHAVYVKYSA